jgi:hypothetical protein
LETGNKYFALAENRCWHPAAQGPAEVKLRCTLWRGQCQQQQLLLVLLLLAAAAASDDDDEIVVAVNAFLLVLAIGAVVKLLL